MVSTEVCYGHREKNIGFLSLSNVHVIIQGIKNSFHGEKEVGGTVDHI